VAPCWIKVDGDGDNDDNSSFDEKDQAADKTAAGTRHPTLLP